jgi:hypothetical protein
MEKIPFSFTLIRGAIGKKFVIKHYRSGPIVTKYPNMKGIIASKKQQTCRQLFKEAAAYALEIIHDANKKKAFMIKTGKSKGLYNAAIKAYLIQTKATFRHKKMCNERRLYQQRNRPASMRYIVMKGGRSPKFVYHRNVFTNIKRIPIIKNPIEIARIKRRPKYPVKEKPPDYGRSLHYFNSFEAIKY